MKLLVIITIFFISMSTFAQKGTYKVLQTLAGNSLDSLRPMGSSSFVSRIEFHDNGIILGISTFATTAIKYSEMDRKNRGWNYYTYTVDLSDQMRLQLNIAPYPGKKGKPQLVSGILMTTFPESGTRGYQKYLFWEDQCLKNTDGTLMQPDEKALKAIYNFGQ